MRDFLWARGATDSGYLINPFFQTSDARKQAGQKAVATSSEHKRLEDAAQAPDSTTKTFISDAASRNIYAAVYSELWQPGGSMRGWLASADEKNALQNLGANVAKIKSDTVKTGWIDNFVVRFSGTSTLAARFGRTFSCDDLGLTGDDAQKWKVGTRQRAMAMVGGLGGYRPFKK